MLWRSRDFGKGLLTLYLGVICVLQIGNGMWLMGEFVPIAGPRSTLMYYLEGAALIHGIGIGMLLLRLRGRILRAANLSIVPVIGMAIVGAVISAGSVVALLARQSSAAIGVWALATETSNFGICGILVYSSLACYVACGASRGHSRTFLRDRKES